MQYLGDGKPGPGRLTAETVKVTPFFGARETVLPLLLAWRQPREDGWGKDRPLKLDGAEYARGLAVRSRTELTYRLRGKFRRLVAVVGIDDQVDAGHVRLIIRGDDKTLFDQPVAWNHEPLELDLDVSGVSRLSVLVDFGEDNDRSDFLDLCEARVIK